MRRIDWRLCFIADSQAGAGKDILRLIAEAVEGGATIIQIRGKKWTGREFVELGIQAARFLRRKNIPLIINDRIDIALACEADGVHLGQADMPLPYARRVLGKDKVIGLSVSDLKEAEAGEGAGANYIGVGPIFATLSKKDTGPIVGLEGLRKIREKIKIPILAIGGINSANASAVIQAGAAGVAVISGITAADNPKKAAAEIIEAIEKIHSSVPNKSTIDYKNGTKGSLIDSGEITGKGKRG